MGRVTLSDFLKDFSSKDNVSFHMPGHKGAGIFIESGYEDEIRHLVETDITETRGADNLFQAEGVIRATMDSYRRLYDAKEAFILVGGSSSGVVASILTCAPPGTKLLLAANCHNSASNGLILSDAKPAYIDTPMLPGYGIGGPIEPSDVAASLDENPDASAVLITSPNYYGICSDIKAIAGEVHSRGKVLIVDEAHGAHLSMLRRTYEAEGIPHKRLDAESQGADIVITSIHKTMASFTQTALALVCSDRIDTAIMADNLRMIQTTSPSYILMQSVDLNAKIVEKRGRELSLRWKENLDWFRARAKEEVPGLDIMNHEMLDETKINLDMSAYDLDGDALYGRLADKGIYLELSCGDIAMGMTGIGNVRRDYERLLEALKEIAVECGPAHELPETDVQEFINEAMYTHNEITSIPRHRRKVHYSEAAGLVSAFSVVPYPPGIPIIVPGEVMTAEKLGYAADLRNQGKKVIGMSKDGYVICGEE